MILIEFDFLKMKYSIVIILEIEYLTSFNV